MEYLAQRRKYEDAMARSAPDLEAVVEDEDDAMDGVEGMLLNLLLSDGPSC
jgi:hypothetical protein